MTFKDLEIGQLYRYETTLDGTVFIKTAEDMEVWLWAWDTGLPGGSYMELRDVPKYALDYEVVLYKRQGDGVAEVEQ